MGYVKEKVYDNQIAQGGGVGYMEGGRGVMPRIHLYIMPYIPYHFNLFILNFLFCKINIEIIFKLFPLCITQREVLS